MGLVNLWQSDNKIFRYHGLIGYIRFQKCVIRLFRWFTLDKLCAFLVRTCNPYEEVHSMRHISIPDEEVYSW